MLIKIATTKDKSGRRLATCRPTDPQSTRILSNFYPDAAWLEDRPFDTAEFTLHISDAPIGDEAAFKLPPLPYIETKGGHSRFEIQDSKGNRIRTSAQHPVTQLTLLASELDPAIIDEERDVYLGVGPAEKPVVGPPNGALAQKYLSFFLQTHVAYFKGAKLSSRQLHTAIVKSAPDGVPTDLLDRKTVTAAFREHFGTGMGRDSARIEGRPTKYWKNFHISVYAPDDLEKSWL